MIRFIIRNRTDKDLMLGSSTMDPGQYICFHKYMSMGTIIVYSPTRIIARIVLNKYNRQRLQFPHSVKYKFNIIRKNYEDKKELHRNQS